VLSLFLLAGVIRTPRVRTERLRLGEVHAEPLLGFGFHGVARRVRPDDVRRQEDERGDRKDDAAGDEPCPALDPATGLCDLYDARPITCRTFGPAVRWGSEAVGACELCYAGATDEQIAQCRVEIDPDGLEAQLLDEMEDRGQTIVAFALTASPTAPDPEPLHGPLRS